MAHWYWFILTVVWGCCVGSFLNVVIYRLPAGVSLLHPPSRCPDCNKSIRWYDNIPVVSWVILRGRCRYCNTRISIQYPIIEAVTGLLFGLLFVSYYVWLNRADISGVTSFLRLSQTWPILLVHAVLVAGLIAATVIDARLYIIPLSIPVTVTLVAVIGLPLAATFFGGAAPFMVVAITSYGRTWALEGIHAGFGGMLGLAVANLLLYFRLLPRSFDESTIPDDVIEQLEQKEGPESWYQFERPRLEVLKETLFLLFPLAGALAGGAYGSKLVAAVAPGWVGQYPAAVLMLGIVLLGYLSGGAVVWAVRIGGTLAFGKEAMGLGDVHLLAAVGACLGWFDPLVIFFIAPFFGLAWTAITAGINALTRRHVKMIPYGPHLAAATLVVMVFHQPVRDLLCRYLLICA